MSFLGVGAPEAILVGIVALVVFGPKGLAEVSLCAMRAAGRVPCMHERWGGGRTMAKLSSAPRAWWNRTENARMKQIGTELKAAWVHGERTKYDVFDDGGLPSIKHIILGPFTP